MSDVKHYEDLNFIIDKLDAIQKEANSLLKVDQAQASKKSPAPYDELRAPGCHKVAPSPAVVPVKSRIYKYLDQSNDIDIDSHEINIEELEKVSRYNDIKNVINGVRSKLQKIGKKTFSIPTSNKTSNDVSIDLSFKSLPIDNSNVVPNVLSRLSHLQALQNAVSDIEKTVGLCDSNNIYKGNRCNISCQVYCQNTCQSACQSVSYCHNQKCGAH